MNENKDKNSQRYVGYGIALGAVGGALVALGVSLITRNDDVWAWTIPVGIAVGLAIGAGLVKSHEEKTNGE